MWAIESSVYDLCTTVELVAWMLGSPRPIYSIWAVMIVRRLRWKFIRTVLWCVVYNCCMQLYANTWADHKFACWFMFRFCGCVFYLGTAFCVCVFGLGICVFLAFVVLGCISSVLALTLLVGQQEGVRPVKTDWWGTGMVICLEWGANDLHMVQLMPLPPIISCFIKIQNGLPFSCHLAQVVLEKRLLNGC